MKKILLSLLAVATLAACAQDETIGNYNQEAIDFDIPFVDNATKATDPTYGAGDNQVDLTEFYVYGTVTGTNNGIVPIFKGDKVTGSVGANAWSCDVKQYWIADATYNFAAVVDATVATNDNGMPTTLTPMAAENGNLKDLLYAFNGPITGKASGNEKVNFEFKHLLSKAYFTVTSNTEDGYYYSVKNISVQNIKTGASYDITNSKWAGTTALDTDTTNWISFGNIEKVTAKNNNQTNAYQTLLVPTTSDFKVSLTVELYNNLGNDDDSDDVMLSSVTYAGDTALSVSQDLKAGHAYNFQLNLSVGELIQFTVTAAPEWANDTNVTL